MMTFIPLDATAHDGKDHTYRADDETLHAASWAAARQAFVYADGTPVAPTITHYLVRRPASTKGHL